MTSKARRPAMIAALTLQVRPGEAMQRLIPAGVFDAPRGSMAGSGPWTLTAERAARIIQRNAGRQSEILIDYEHQSLKAEANGQPVLAAAWANPQALEWRPDGPEPGLYGEVRWTSRASGYIAADEYRYLSPVFTYDDSGNVLDLINIALTNEPAIDEPTIAALSARIHFDYPSQETEVNETLKKLLATLGLAETTDEAIALQAVAALKAKGDDADTRIAALTTQATENEAQIAALTTGNPDPAKFVPVAAIQDMQKTVAALSARLAGSEIDAAIADGKLTPALRDWAIALGTKDIAALRTYIETAPAIAALTGTQTGGTAPDGANGGNPLDEGDMAVCTALGLTPEEFAKGAKQ